MDFYSASKDILYIETTVTYLITLFLPFAPIHLQQTFRTKLSIQFARTHFAKTSHALLPISEWQTRDITRFTP